MRPLRLANQQMVAWTPDLSAAETWEDEWELWRSYEATHLEQIHAIAKEWVLTGELPNLSPEIIYHLGLRLRAALNIVGTAFISTEQGPSSLFCFPPLPIQGVAEWLLTEWGDEHAIYLVFPEPTEQ